MAIRNDQYLHRLTAGRGAIKPDDPLEVRLYGPDGQPIGVQDDALKVALSGSIDVSDRIERDLGRVTFPAPQPVSLPSPIEVLFEGSISNITAGSTVVIGTQYKTDFREVRVGVAMYSGQQTNWLISIEHRHGGIGNTFGSDEVINIGADNTALGRTGIAIPKGSWFEIRARNNGTTDRGLYRVTILGVR